MSPSLEWFPAASTARAHSEEHAQLMAEVAAGKLIRAAVYLADGEEGIKTEEIFFPEEIDSVIVAAGVAQYMGALGIELFAEKTNDPNGCRIRISEQVEALKTYRTLE